MSLWGRGAAASRSRVLGPRGVANPQKAEVTAAETGVLPSLGIELPRPQSEMFVDWCPPRRLSQSHMLGWLSRLSFSPKVTLRVLPNLRSGTAPFTGRGWKVERDAGTRPGGGAGTRLRARLPRTTAKLAEPSPPHTHTPRTQAGEWVVTWIALRGQVSRCVGTGWQPRASPGA